MAWTAPATVVTGAVITAAYGNTHIRDNFLHLAGTAGVVDLSATSKHISHDALIIRTLGM